MQESREQTTAVEVEVLIEVFIHTPGISDFSTIGTAGKSGMVLLGWWMQSFRLSPLARFFMGFLSLFVSYLLLAGRREISQMYSVSMHASHGTLHSVLEGGGGWG